MSKGTRVGNIIQVRSNDNNEMVIEGYALKFDTWSKSWWIQRNDFTSRFRKH